MPLYTRTEIREMCGINTATLTMYTKRGKIIMSGDFIDDTIPQNITQIEKWKVAKIKKDALKVDKVVPEKKTGTTKTEQPPKPPAKKKTEKKTGRKAPAYKEPKIPFPKTKDPPPNPNDPEIKKKIAEANARLKLEDDLKQVTYDQKLLAKQKAEIELEHTKGKLIPTKLVGSVITALGVGFQNSYKNESSQLLIEIAQKTKMSDEDAAFFKGKLIEMINKAHTNAITEAESSLISLIEQNQLKKIGK